MHVIWTDWLFSSNDSGLLLASALSEMSTSLTPHPFPQDDYMIRLDISLLVMQIHVSSSLSKYTHGLFPRDKCLYRSQNIHVQLYACLYSTRNYIIEPWPLSHHAFNYNYMYLGGIPPPPKFPRL